MAVFGIILSMELFLAQIFVEFQLVVRLLLEVELNWQLAFSK